MMGIYFIYYLLQLVDKSDAPQPLTRQTELMICPDFSLIWPGFPLRPEKHLIQTSANKMLEFRNFVLHNSIVIVDSEQVYLKLQIT